MTKRLLKNASEGPRYAHIELKIEPAAPEEFVSSEETASDAKIILGGNILQFGFGQSPGFMQLYNEYKHRIRRTRVASLGDRLYEQQIEDQKGPTELANYRVIRPETHGNAVVFFIIIYVLYPFLGRDF